LANQGCIRLYGNPDEEYDLDDPEAQQKLGIAKWKQHADGYCHFTNCHWLVEERKRANQIKTAIEQLESTVRQLQSNQRKVTETVIVMEKLSRAEQHRFYVDPKTHELRIKDSAQGIRILGLKETVKVFFEKDIERIIAERREYDWASVSS
jgi:hypothetical protein